MRIIQRSSVWLLLWSLSGLAQADHPVEETQIHGFVSQGYVNSSANRFMGDSRNGSLDFSEIGINLSQQLTPGITASGQVLLRRAGAMYDGSASLDYALLDFTLDADESHRHGLLLGRFKNPLGFYNDTRDVAFTRPSVFMPQTIYFDKVRNFILSNDGALWSSEWFGEDDYLNLQIGGGQSPIDVNVKYAYLGSNPLDGSELQGDYDAKGLTLVGRVLYEMNGGQWRFALSGANGTMAMNNSGTLGNLGLYPGNGEVKIEYYIASMQYNADNWFVTAEFMREPVQWSGFNPQLFHNNRISAEGYYLQGDYRLTPEWQAFVRYEVGFGNRFDKDGKQAAAASGGHLKPYNLFSKDWIVGARWDFARNWMLRSELQRKQGTFTLSDRENPNPGALQKDWNLFALLLSYRF